MRSIVLGCLSSPFDLASCFDDIAQGTLDVVFNSISLFFEFYRLVSLNSDIYVFTIDLLGSASRIPLLRGHTQSAEGMF
jgi:hypothetical protein